MNGSRKTLTMATMMLLENSEAPTRMKKRKDLLLQHFHHDFPSVLPSPKSRRLDAELCTIMEEEEEEEEEGPNVMVHEDSSPAPAPACVPPPSSEERALVLYDPAKNTPLVKSPGSPADFPIFVKADLIPGLKDYLFSWGIAKPDNSKEREIRREKSSDASSDCLAVVPWVAFDSPMENEGVVPETGQLLEVEEGEMMEMDEPYVDNNSEKAMEIGDKVETVGASSPWQQQHCMMLNVLQNNSTPIHWC